MRALRWIIIALLLLTLTYGEAMRIVSLAPSITEILFDIGAGDEVVGVTASCDWPPEAKEREIVAGVSPNFQAILALKPDLVILDEQLMGKYIPTFEKLSINYLAISHSDWKDVFKNILLIGRATGHYQEARELVAELLSDYKEVVQVLNECNPKRQRILVVMWYDPIYTMGTDTELYGFFRELKTEPLALPGDYGNVNFEWVLANQPDVIVVLGDEVRDKLEADPLFTSLKAWQSGDVLTLDPSLILRPTPRMVRTFVYLARKLHPECFSYNVFEHGWYGVSDLGRWMGEETESSGFDLRRFR